MKTPSYRTIPESSGRMPTAIPFLVMNEAAERFSYYGMRAILVIFMTDYLLNHDGGSDVMGEAEARKYFHLFASAVYFFPIVGSVVADVFWGKFRTIVVLSIVYCFGHLALAVDQTRLGLPKGTLAEESLCFVLFRVALLVCRVAQVRKLCLQQTHHIVIELHHGRSIAVRRKR